MLSITATEAQDNWDLQLPQLMFEHQTSIQETTNSTPYHLVFGREAQLPPVDVMFHLPYKEKEVPTAHHAIKLREKFQNCLKWSGNT